MITLRFIQNPILFFQISKYKLTLPKSPEMAITILFFVFLIGTFIVIKDAEAARAESVRHFRKS